MNIAFLKNFGLAVGKHLIKYGPTYAKIAIGVGVGTLIGITACRVYYQKVIKTTTTDLAKEMEKEFARRVKELEDKYKHNEYVFKKKINDLCDEFGIEHVA